MQEIGNRRMIVAGQLIPLPEFAPPVPQDLPSEQWIALWCDLYDAGEKLLLAGLRLQIGPDGDIKRAYQDWLRQYYDDHDQTLIRLAAKLNRSKETHAG
jgi:hypothetical protein